MPKGDNRPLTMNECMGFIFMQEHLLELLLRGTALLSSETAKRRLIDQAKAYIDNSTHNLSEGRDNLDRELVPAEIANGLEKAKLEFADLLDRVW